MFTSFLLAFLFLPFGESVPRKKAGDETPNGEKGKKTTSADFSFSVRRRDGGVL